MIVWGETPASAFCSCNKRGIKSGSFSQIRVISGGLFSALRLSLFQLGREIFPLAHPLFEL
jgi:hypothetical protein